jgi:transcriptional regulator with XRE-family HTH domain
MAARVRTYSPQAIDAMTVLGLEIARARRARRWTIDNLAERAGVSAPTMRKVEQGDPTVAIGTVFEVATLVGVALFDADRAGLRDLVERGRTRLALLPSRVRESDGPVNDDF